MARRVLIVEDDRDIGNLVELHLADLECEVDRAYDGPTGLNSALARAYDLIILDLMLPGLDGIELCRRIRQEGGAFTPILMLTARTSELDRVLGLEIGADDYLTKPFSIRELLARVKAIFRRVEAMSAGDVLDEPAMIATGGMEIDTVRRRVTVGGVETVLTAREFDLLRFFASHPGRVFTRAELLDHVWGYGHDGYEHTVNSHINRLRSKIEADPSHPSYVVTVWGVGYRFAETSEHSG